MAVKGNLWRFAFHVRFTFGVSRLAFRVSFRVSFGVSYGSRKRHARFSFALPIHDSFSRSDLQYPCRFAISSLAKLYSCYIAAQRLACG